MHINYWITKGNLLSQRRSSFQRYLKLLRLTGSCFRTFLDELRQRRSRFRRYLELLRLTGCRFHNVLELRRQRGCSFRRVLELLRQSGSRFRRVLELLRLTGSNFRTILDELRQWRSRSRRYLEQHRLAGSTNMMSKTYTQRLDKRKVWIIRQLQLSNCFSEKTSRIKDIAGRARYWTLITFLQYFELYLTIILNYFEL